MGELVCRQPTVVSDTMAISLTSSQLAITVRRRAASVLGQIAARVDAPSEEDAPSPPAAPTRASLMNELTYPITGASRTTMTLSSNDCETIPKVADAGSTVAVEGKTIQIMHNGLRVERGGYYGDWMAEIIEGLRGHHEPQEELVFHRILERVSSPKPAMLELGAFWAYYSLWFLHSHPDGTAVCAEPDPDHRAVGERNAALNDLHPIFLPYATGSTEATISMPSELHPSVTHTVVVRSVPEIMAETGLDRLDILHMDIQGFELTALAQAEELLAASKVRFLVVSTHHHSISGSPITHQDCLRWLTDHGGHIIAEHTVAESFSGDGLIACSFDPADADFTIDLSHNRPADSLFGAPEIDYEKALEAIDQWAEAAAQDQTS